ncbi:hypothetical protein BSA16_32145 [Micromonospora sp. Rc5]|nr:hypothetical protein BSA16_32145 [Micromonospora sp. Rc5]
MQWVAATTSLRSVAVTVLIRPEQICLATTGGPLATVVRQDFHGHDALTTLRLEDGTVLTARRSR